MNDKLKQQNNFLWIALTCLMGIIIFFTVIVCLQEDQIRKQDKQYYELGEQYRKLLRDHKHVINEINKSKQKPDVTRTN